MKGKVRRKSKGTKRGRHWHGNYTSAHLSSSAFKDKAPGRPSPKLGFAWFPRIYVFSLPVLSLRDALIMSPVAVMG